MNDTKQSGVINLYKPEGITSHDAVDRIRRVFHTRQAGHTGTLDPMASGVLPILVGSAVKASEFLVCDDKEYRAGLLLGLVTDTEDITGTVLEQSAALPGEARVREAAESFRGGYLQIPPMYSALKVNGKKLYELARGGKTVPRDPRPVEIPQIAVEEKLAEDRYLLKVSCSKGTYIRTLLADIGKKLGCGGVMFSLERLRAGQFTSETSVSLPLLQNAADPAALLLPTEGLFASYPEIRPEPFYQRLLKNGAEMYLSRTALPLLRENAENPEYLGRRFRLYDADGFFALGEVRAFEAGLALKPIKFF